MSDPSPQKRRKLDEDNDVIKPKFSGFSLTRVLNDIPEKKLMTVLGEFADGEAEAQAVVVLEKTPFTEDSARGILSVDTTHTTLLENDIYGSYQLFPKTDLNAVKASLVYPASEKHIKKYSAQTFFMVEESPEDYKTITFPHLEGEQFSIQWVYNILEKKTESERIVFEDADPKTGFILLPDMKWDGHLVESLYLVAIVHQHGIRSLRDLDDTHLPLLTNIMEKGCEAIKEKYKVPRSQLRVYIHYQPSYYHLHVHFTHLRYEAGGSSVERAHLLADVINNIQMYPKFYSKKTLTFPAREQDSLYKKFKEAGKVDC